MQIQLAALKLTGSAMSYRQKANEYTKPGNWSKTEIKRLAKINRKAKIVNSQVLLALAGCSNNLKFCANRYPPTNGPPRKVPIKTERLVYNVRVIVGSKSGLSMQLKFGTAIYVMNCLPTN